MSRTYKDKDFYLRYPEEKYDFSEKYIGVWPMEIGGVKTKKPKTYKGDWKWYKRTPGWFVREFMQAPKRAACRNWEQNIKFVADFDDYMDCPDYGRKPHVYFY